MIVRNTFFFLLGLLFLITTYSKLKKRLFSEKESFFWVIWSIILMFSFMFIPILNLFSQKIGIAYPPSLLFLLLLLFLLFLVFRMSQQIYIQNEKIKELSQIVALIKKGIEEKD